MTDSVTNSAGRLRLTDEERKDFGIPSKHVTTDCGLVFMESDVERIVTQRVRDALAAANAPSRSGAAADDAADDGAGMAVIAATGNGMKSHDLYDTFIEVSGGDGNRDNGPEVHLRIRSNDGHNEGQSWFPAADVLAAVQRAAGLPPRATLAPTATPAQQILGPRAKTGAMGSAWVAYDSPKPAAVPDPDTYWNDPPPTQSARCDWWVRQIERGWLPNRRIRAEGYYSAAGWYGVYIWEYRNVITPAIDAQAASRAANDSGPADHCFPHCFHH